MPEAQTEPRDYNPSDFWPVRHVYIGAQSYREEALIRQRDEALERAVAAEAALQAFKWGDPEVITEHLAERFDCTVTMILGLTDDQRVRRELAKEEERRRRAEEAQSS